MASKLPQMMLMMNVMTMKRTRTTTMTKKMLRAFIAFSPSPSPSPLPRPPPRAPCPSALFSVPRAPRPRLCGAAGRAGGGRPERNVSNAPPWAPPPTSPVNIFLR